MAWKSLATWKSLARNWSVRLGVAALVLAGLIVVLVKFQLGLQPTSAPPGIPNTQDTLNDSVVFGSRDTSMSKDTSMKGMSADTVKARKPPFKAGNVLIPVFYGTDRAREANGEYGADRGMLEEGIVRVSIPLSTHRYGHLERPHWWHFEFSENPDRHITVADIKALSDPDFRKAVATAIEAGGSAQALVFIHGFNESFDDAARRCAQIVYDIRFPGVALIYSWPSEGHIGLVAYHHDESAVTYSTPHFRQFLRRVLGITGADRVQIVAHSMGARLVGDALQDSSFAQDKNHLDQIVFAAPDIDAGVFETQIATPLRSSAARVTIYGSAKDQALFLAGLYDGYSRVGEGGHHLWVGHGFDTVDATDVDLGLIGHGYFAEVARVMSDMGEVLADGRVPPRQLLQAKLRGLTYWQFAP